MYSILRSTYPGILKLIWVPNLELLPFFFVVTPRRVIKIAGQVDLDKLNMFSVYTQHLSLIVFEIKDEKY
jgi:hypothetical protein